MVRPNNDAVIKQNSVSENLRNVSISFIGSVGVPNRYGGFESFLEHCSPVFASQVKKVFVTCDTNRHEDRSRLFFGVERIFVYIPANGKWSIIHDLWAFFTVLNKSSHIVVLGVSGGIWFPLFHFLCAILNKKLIVNIDGVEWRRGKYSGFQKILLKQFDYLAQRFSDIIIFDNPALSHYIHEKFLEKSVCIGYSGDHVIRIPNLCRGRSYALTICRIEPENNIEMLIEGFLLSSISEYKIVGNWRNSKYGLRILSRYFGVGRLSFLDPIYDCNELAKLREMCSIYIHGHSVGGTNPSLVEMLFYDCPIMCFDVSFNRESAGECAGYFKCASELSHLSPTSLPPLGNRALLRAKYSSNFIVKQYLDLLR